MFYFAADAHISVGRRLRSGLGSRSRTVADGGDGRIALTAKLKRLRCVENGCAGQTWAHLRPDLGLDYETEHPGSS